MPQVGEKAPAFTLPTTEGPVSLSDFAGRKLVLAFYTEDSTPGCTQELTAFKEEFPTVQEAHAAVLGVSADGLDSHRAFCAGLGGCPFPLASDPTLEVARLYGVVAADGKRSVRAVFVIGEDGTVLHSIPWYQPGNPGQFLAVFQALGVA